MSNSQHTFLPLTHSLPPCTPSLLPHQSCVPVRVHVFACGVYLSVCVCMFMYGVYLCVRVQDAFDSPPCIYIYIHYTNRSRTVFPGRVMGFIDTWPANAHEIEFVQFDKRLAFETLPEFSACLPTGRENGTIFYITLRMYCGPTVHWCDRSGIIETNNSLRCTLTTE